MVNNSKIFFYHILCHFLLGIALFCPFSIWAQEVDTLKLLYHWSDSTLEGSSQYDNTYNEVWGFVQNSREYAVIGSTAGTHIFPVDDPSAQEIFINSSSSGAHVIHRDYHDYQGYLYAVCDEGNSSTLQIIDISQIEDSVSVVYDSDTLLKRCHNIFIDSARSKLYACAQKGGATAYTPLALYDISNPVDPILINTYATFGGGSIGHVHDAYVYNDTAFLNCGFDGLRIVNFSDPSNPELLATLTDYPFRGYNHSGWTSEDRSYYYMADETHGAELKALDITDMQEPEVVTTFSAESSSEFSIPHNQLVHCNYLYVPYYFDGLQVYDIKNADNPVRSFVYPTSKEAHIRNYKGAWGVYPFLPSGKVLVSDMQEGLFILQGPECEFETDVQHVDTKLNFKVYPNPSSGTFYISLPIGFDQAFIRISDMNGAKVFHQEINSHEFNLSSALPAGVYLLHVSTKTHYGQELLIISP